MVTVGPNFEIQIIQGQKEPFLHPQHAIPAAVQLLLQNLELHLFSLSTGQIHALQSLEASLERDVWFSKGKFREWSLLPSCL